MIRQVPAPVHQRPAFYEMVAAHYDLLHRGWMHFAGSDALAAVEGGIASMLPPRAQVLDAGCGTGLVARRLQQIDPDIRLTLCDASSAMLSRTEDIVADRYLGDVYVLPFADNHFDVVVCTWVLETLSGDPNRAMSELLRVLKPGGLLTIAISSRPSSPVVRFRMAWLINITRWLGAGRFLEPATIATLATPKGRLLNFHNGLSTVVMLRKQVEAKAALQCY